MSRQQSKKFYQVYQQPKEIFFKESTDQLDTKLKKRSQYYLFERNTFLVSFLMLISTTVYINKTFLQHYNFRILFLVTIYLSRRFIKQLWLSYHIKTYQAIQSYNILITLLIIQLCLNILYILISLLDDYRIIDLCPLSLGLVVQVVLFNRIRYESIQKECIFLLLKIAYVTIDIIYYTILIPMYYSSQYHHYYSYYDIVSYALFSFVLLMVYISSFNYMSKCANYYFYAVINGNWKSVQRRDIPPEIFHKIKQWIPKQNYERETIVEHHGKYYIAKEEKNTVKPNNLYSNLFYKVFINPNKIINHMLRITSIVIAGEITLSLLTIVNVLSLSIIFISWRIYNEILQIRYTIKTMFIEE